MPILSTPTQTNQHRPQPDHHATTSTSDEAVATILIDEGARRYGLRRPPGRARPNGAPPLAQLPTWRF